jgi:hypothetical protein
MIVKINKDESVYVSYEILAYNIKNIKNIIGLCCKNKLEIGSLVQFYTKYEGSCVDEQIRFYKKAISEIGLCDNYISRFFEINECEIKSINETEGSILIELFPKRYVNFSEEQYKAIYGNILPDVVYKISFLRNCPSEWKMDVEVKQNVRYLK